MIWSISLVKGGGVSFLKKYSWARQPPLFYSVKKFVFEKGRGRLWTSPFTQL